MIKNIIFDMGGVLCDFNPPAMMAKLPINDTHIPILYRELFHSQEWILFDAGEVTEEEVLEKTCARAKAHILAGFYGPWAEEKDKAEAFIREIGEEIGICLRGWVNEIMPIPEMEPVVAALKEAGYRIFLLSNASVQFERYQDRVPAFQYMEGLFVSGYHRMIKPEKEIYRAFLSEYGLKAEECIFIEDNPANLAGAYTCGIEGIVFNGDVDELWLDLKRFGIEGRSGPEQ